MERNKARKYKSKTLEEEEEEEERKGEDEEMELRRGPWTVEEDVKLINHIALHGEGKWNSLAPSAGLKRTGKSCRLRWLNYLRPDIRLGNITLEEQLLILQLHSRWGNRWSKIAQYLPGRTDNEIKNYWRTRVQKHAKSLKCDVNSKQFKDTLKYLWIPRLAERIAASTATAAAPNDPNAPQASYGRNAEFAPSYTAATSSSESFRNQVSPLSDVNDDAKPGSFFGVVDQMDYGPLDQTNGSWLDGGDVSDNFWDVDEFHNWFLHQQHQLFK